MSRTSPFAELDLTGANLSGLTSAMQTLTAQLSPTRTFRAQILRVPIWVMPTSPTNFSYADLTAADLRDAKVQGAFFGASNFSGARLWGLEGTANFHVALGADVSYLDLSATESTRWT